jgi:chaperonin GroES
MELGVRVGDTVFYGKYSGTDVEVDGEKFVILRESDLLGVLE